MSATPAPRRFHLSLRPGLRAALDRASARLGLGPTQLLAALLAELVDREGAEPVPPVEPWAGAGPRVDETGDRERVGAVLDRRAPPVHTLVSKGIQRKVRAGEKK